jgi:hypothetical protein
VASYCRRIAMTDVERTPVLVLSQKAAKVLKMLLETLLANKEESEDTEVIVAAIIRELDEQIEEPKKKAKKSKSKKRK